MIRFAVMIFMLLAVVLPVDLLGFPRQNDKPTSLVYPTFLHTYGIRKATKTHLMLYTRNRIKVNDPQGIAVTRLLSWDDPTTKKDDDEVTGYGVNSGENIIVYNTSMKSLGFYGFKEKGVKALNRPSGIAANALGDVYVADTGNDRVVRLFNPRKQLKFVKAIGGHGTLPGKFLQPHDVALDADRFVYITDYGNHRVQILRPDDLLHHWFGKPGVDDGFLWHPTGIAVTNGHEKWSHYKDKFIVLIDLDGTRLQKFTLDGKFLKAVRLSDFGYTDGKLMYLAIDYYSQIWVTDFRNGCIHKFDRDLNYLTSFGKEGTGDREFYQPRGIAIYKRFGQVFVAEKESAQYYWVGTDISNVSAKYKPEEQLVELTFELTEPSFVTLEVRKSPDGFKGEVFSKAQFFTSKQRVYVDGKYKRIPAFIIRNFTGANAMLKDKIEPVLKGRYELRLRIEPTYSSYKYFSKEIDVALEVK